MKIKNITGLFVLLVSLGAVRTKGLDLYVSTQGLDVNPGTSLAPLRTIGRAYSLAVAGATINVAPGVYTDYTSGWGLR